MREPRNLSESYNYIEKLLPKPVFAELCLQAQQNATDLGLQDISLSSTEARILQALISLSGCEKVVEIGTLTGHSALWILSGMSKGKLWTFEKEAEHAIRAQKTLNQWCGPAQAEVIVGDARENLKNISNQGPFDAVFIDGNKSAYLDYLNWSEENLAKGGLVIADNVFLRGSVYQDGLNTPFSEKQVLIMREFNKRLADSSRYQSCIIPTSDGIFVAKKIF